MDTMDELIGRWHTLAGLPRDQIAAQFNDENRILFAEVVTQGLGDTSHGGEKFASADEFAQHVLDLRSNERAWSRHLGEVLLKAQDQFDGGNVEEARKTLHSFCAACPWRRFVEIADTELQRFGN